MLIEYPLLRSSADNFNLHRLVVISIANDSNSVLLNGIFSIMEITASLKISFGSIFPTTSRVRVCFVRLWLFTNTSTLDAYTKTNSCVRRRHILISNELSADIARNDY